MNLAAKGTKRLILPLHPSEITLTPLEQGLGS